jgi:serine/threonine protein kinase/putative intracellular protease/amidase
LFEQALELRSPAELQTFLDQQCAQDPAMRAELEGLFSAYSSAGDFLEEPAADLQGVWSEVPDTHASPPETQSGGKNTNLSTLDFLDPPRQADHLGRLAHYEIWEVVGSGGMGVVMKAFDEKLQRLVAIKALAPAWAASESARKRFVREARTAAAVCHDHLVPIYAVEDDNPVPYFVMQYIAGESLQQRIDREGPLSVGEILRIGSQIAEGLAAAHRQGLVHRDIKPGNILLERVNWGQGTDSSSGSSKLTGDSCPLTPCRVKLTDFGLARAVDDASLSREGLIAGTPEYMSPEQAQGQAVDHRSDLFSLGSVLYAMCTGKSPFAAKGSLAALRRIGDDMPQDVRELRTDVPARLAELIARLHAKRPADRPRSADEVRTLLAQGSNHPVAMNGPEPRISRRQWLAAGGAVAGVVGLAFCLPRLRLRHQGPAQVAPLQHGRVEDLRPEPAPVPAAVPAQSRRWQPRVLLIIAPRDFYYPEYHPVRNVLEANGIECRTASATLEECRPNIHSPQVPVTPDLRLADANVSDYDAIYFCGGEGSLEFAEGGAHAVPARRLIREALATKCTVSAMGVAVVALAEADVLDGRQAACNPYGTPPGIYVRRAKARGVQYLESSVVEDGPFLTGRSPDSVRLFAESLVKRLGIAPRALPGVRAATGD